MSTELAGPVSAPTHPFPAGSPPSSGGLGVSGPVGPPQMGVSTLGYPSGLAGPTEIGARSVEQVSPSSIATVAAVEQPSTPQSSSLAAAPYRQQLASRQPPAAATETAAAQDLTQHNPASGVLLSLLS